MRCTCLICVFFADCIGDSYSHMQGGETQMTCTYVWVIMRAICVCNKNNEDVKNERIRVKTEHTFCECKCCNCNCRSPM